MEVNEKIRELRKAVGFSQSYMAEKLNLSQKAYSKMECGETQLTFDRITEIARVMGYNSWQIIALDVDVVLGKKPMPDDVANYAPIYLVKKLFDNYELKIKLLEEELKIANAALNQLNHEKAKL